MKYFNPSYWFKLWVLITPIFQNKIQSINAKSIYSEERDGTPKNISILGCSQSNYQDISCIHEAGHTVIILDSKFKNKFQNLEIISSNSKYLGKTISYEFVPLNQIKNISNDDLYTLLQINLGGYAAESIFFDNNPLKYIIGQSRIMDSHDLQDYHDTYKKEFESRKLKPYNEDSLSFIGKQLNITRRKLNNKPEFKKIIKTCCLINGVNKKHGDYILKNKEIPIPLFTKQQIQALTRQQIQTLTAEEFKAFLATQIQTGWIANTYII